MTVPHFVSNPRLRWDTATLRGVLPRRDFCSQQVASAQAQARGRAARPAHSHAYAFRQQTSGALGGSAPSAEIAASQDHWGTSGREHAVGEGLPIEACASEAELQQLYVQEQWQMDSSELYRMCNRLASLSEAAKGDVEQEGGKALAQQLLQAVEQRLEGCSLTELTTLAAAATRLRCAPDQAWAASLMAHAIPKLPAASPAQLSQLARTVSRLRMPLRVLKAAPSFRPWMAAMLAASLPDLLDYRVADLLRLLEALGRLNYRPAAAWMTRLCNALQAELHAMDTEALSRTLLALARLDYEPHDACMQALQRQLEATLALFDDRDLATAAQAFARMPALRPSPGLMDVVLAEVGSKMPGFAAPQLAMLVAALAQLDPRLGSSGGGGWVQAAGQRIATLLWRMNTTSLSQCLWGLSVLGYRPDQRFLDEVIKASQSKLPNMQQADFLPLMSALANFNFAPPSRAAFARWFAHLCACAAKQRFAASQAADLLYTLACLGPGQGQAPSQPLVASLLQELVRQGLRRLAPAKLARVSWALQQLRAAPSGAFAAAFCEAVRTQLSSFAPADLALLLGSLRWLKQGARAASVQSDLWACSLLTAAHSNLDAFDAESLTTLIAGLSSQPTALRPSQPWLAAVAARLLQLSDTLPVDTLAACLKSLVVLGYTGEGQHAALGPLQAALVTRRAAASGQDWRAGSMRHAGAPGQQVALVEARRTPAAV